MRWMCWMCEQGFPNAQYSTENHKVHRNDCPVWLHQNWKRFLNPLRLFRPDFLKLNPDSCNNETSPGTGFIGFKMADDDGEVSVETSDNLFKQFTVPISQWKVKETKHLHFCKIRIYKIDIWIKTRSRFCLVFHKLFSELTFCLLTTPWFHVLRIRVLKSRCGFGLIKQGLNICK